MTRTRWDRSPLATALLLALLAAPLTAQMLRGAPCADDFNFHLLRLAQLEALLADGVVYSRWAPDMALGYGFPLFNFYAPLSYYLAALVNQLAPTLQAGLRLAFALSIWGAGLTMYVLARDYLRRTAALAAATAYMTAPYLGYDVYFRGNLAESVAWLWFPLALWAMGRLVRRGGPGWLAATALAYAAVLLTHNVLALLFSPVLAFFALIWWLGEREEPAAGRRLGEALAALLLGLGLAAFFWWPALAERDLVYSERLLTSPTSVYWNNFVSLREVFALPRPIYPDLINPSPPRALGLLPALLALPALATLGAAGQRRRLAVAAWLVVLAAVFLMLPPSDVIWARVPLLEYAQFPWRLLAPAALCLALLVGVAVDLVLEPLMERRRGKAAALAGALPLLLFPPAHLFWFTPRHCDTWTDPKAADIAVFERETGTIGTTALGEYVPRAVTRFPDATAESPFRWPDGVNVLAQGRAGITSFGEVEAPTSLSIVTNLFAYPGWQALVDGQAVPTGVMPETGLLTFRVPAGRHTVTVRWRETPLRRTANGISLAALTLAATLALIAARCERYGLARPEVGGDVPDWLPWLAATVVAAALLVVIPRVDSPLRRPLLQDGGPAASLIELNMTFADELRLAGYWLSPAGENRWRFDLIWEVMRVPQRPYQTTMVLRDDAGILWSDEASTLPRAYRQPYDARSWLPGQVVLDSHLVSSLPGTPPGAYVASVTLFDRETLLPLAPAGSNAGPVALTTVDVAGPGRPPDPSRITWRQDAQVAWGGVRLLGYDLDRTQARPGDPFQATFFWSVDGAPAVDLLTHVSLVAVSGAELWETVVPPARAGWPTTAWEAGDLWRGKHAWRLPADLPGGEHQWTLRLCPRNGSCTAAPFALGSLTINEPDRLWVAPPVAVDLDAIFGDVARLRGMTVSPTESGNGLSVQLVWEALGESAVSYRVFVHMLDENGSLLAQSDGEPAAWTRPTTGWLAGEIIVDDHVVALPGSAKVAQLAVGLYDPDAGTRVALRNGSDRLELSLP